MGTKYYSVSDRIYFPMTCNILTVGHIKCLMYLREKGVIIIGLLTHKALGGYKQEIVPFSQRKYILENLGVCVSVVPQNSLNPTSNIKKYGCYAIASGDGWEKEELKAIKKLKLKVINIKLKGERKKNYSSTKIINKIKKHERNTT